MKRANLIFFFALAIVSFGFISNYFTDVPESPDGIHFFKGSWKEAVAKAKADNKLIFLDVYATWCGPCRMLKKKTFPDKAAGQYFNDHYVNVSIDGETEEGNALVQKYALRAYPSLVILNADEKPVAIEFGYHSADWLLNFGKSNLEKQNSK